MGAHEPVPVHYTVPVASAQVKSAILLAGLNVAGHTVVVEKTPTRDHTERMLAGFGASVTIEDTAQGRVITLVGHPDLRAQRIRVPRDPSSAAFAICAALIVPGSDVVVPDIGLNPTRIGLYETLREMGADLGYENRCVQGGEPTACVRARFSPGMRGVVVPPERAASMIDEYPILAVVAANATGTTHMPGVGELRVKECDRIEAMARGLQAGGVDVAHGPDWWSIEGCGPAGVRGGQTCATFLDHRIAMSFLCAGLAAQAPITVDDAGPIATSFPGFLTLMRALGADIADA